VHHIFIHLSLVDSKRNYLGFITMESGKVFCVGIVIGFLGALVAISLGIPPAGVSAAALLTLILTSLLTLMFLSPAYGYNWQEIKNLQGTFLSTVLSCAVAGVAVAIARKMAGALSIPVVWAAAVAALMLFGYCALGYVFFSVVKRYR
jgi:hypothetical protein